MPRALSEDLRKRAVAAYRKSGDALSVAEQFSVCERSVKRWSALEAEHGSVASGYKRCGRKGKIETDERFIAFAAAHAHSTLSQMVSAWTEPLSEMSMSRALRRAGITRKKRPMVTSNAAKKSGRPS
jgi:transposase